MGDPIEELVGLLARLPGIGERTARRLSYHILGSEPEYAAALGAALSTLHERVKRCDDCGNYTQDRLCSICRDQARDASVLCIVATPPDVGAVERSGTYRGRYHVLHGLLSPLDGVGPDQLPTDKLLERVKQDSVREVIVATPLSVEGEATALYLAQVLRPLGVRCSRIASGLPHGGELEFTDQVTLGRALQDRKEL